MYASVTNVQINTQHTPQKENHEASALSIMTEVLFSHSFIYVLFKNTNKLKNILDSTHGEILWPVCTAGLDLSMNHVFEWRVNPGRR